MSSASAITNPKTSRSQIEAVAVAAQRVVAALRAQEEAAKHSLDAAQQLRVLAQKDGVSDAMVEQRQMLAAAAAEVSREHGVISEAHKEIMAARYAELGGRPNARGKSAEGSGASAARTGLAGNRQRKAMMQKEREATKVWAVPKEPEVESQQSAAQKAAAAAKEVPQQWLEELGHRPQEKDRNNIQEPVVKMLDGKEALDLSMFHKKDWDREAEKVKLMAAMPDTGGVKVYRDHPPKPQSTVKQPNFEIRVRTIRVNTEEKVVRAYQQMAAGGGGDRNGFLLGASLSRFEALARDRSDDPSASKGGDIGWVMKDRLEPMLEQTVWNTPKGACSPPVRVKLACFHLVFVEDRR
eukprot:gnl/MRDRNA2_/MRDRNA2_36532_c0_seq1.p1 gnl/MRDRNA2_/MRDRNA2_36532_c0~~gnl/MRDRNA2_/MRDRNA2_36532_c0_seq1.p1  ORF type:complete len:373 (-),score=106.51 gnl/MRDRNA2_/MRDRNA2_36532_c0_seq1:26-1084(-)